MDWNQEIDSKSMMFHLIEETALCSRQRENLHVLSATTGNSSESKECIKYGQKGDDGPIHGHQGPTPRHHSVLQNGRLLRIVP